MTEQTIELLAAELADARRVALSYLRMATKRKKELTQTHEDWAHAKIEAGKLDAALTDAHATRDALTQKAEMRTAQLAQARAELKDLQGANREYGRQLGTMRESREFWRGECRGAEIERDEMRKEMQERDRLRSELARVNIKLNCVCQDVHDWLSPAEAEGLRRQLAASEQRVKELEPVLFTESAQHNYIEGLRDRLRLAKERTEQAEAALQTERKLRREAERIGEAMSEMARSRGERLVKAEQRAENAKVRISHLSQVLNIESQRAERAEARVALVVNEGTAELLDGLIALAKSTDINVPMLLQGPMLRVIDDAHKLVTNIREILKTSEANTEGDSLRCPRCGELFHDQDIEDNPEKYWTCPLCKTIEHRKCRGLLLDDTEVRSHEYAKSLAALVTPELANILVSLANTADIYYLYYHKCITIAEDARDARALAAQIREALDDSKA